MIFLLPQTCKFIAVFSVRDENDLWDDSKTFHPDMSHQLFGDRYMFTNVGQKCAGLV